MACSITSLRVVYQPSHLHRRGPPISMEYCEFIERSSSESDRGTAMQVLRRRLLVRPVGSNFAPCLHYLLEINPMFFWRSRFFYPKISNNCQHQCHNLRISEPRELLYSEIFAACLVKVPHRFPKQYCSCQRKVVLKLGT